MISIPEPVEGAVSACAFENDACAPDVFLYGISVGDDGFEALLVVGTDGEGDAGSHDGGLLWLWVMAYLS